jgi:hypothetical protein
MTEVRETCELGAPAHEVWGLVADFGGLLRCWSLRATELCRPMVLVGA